MGNDVQKLAEKHAPHIPQLDESLVDAHPLVTGAVFIPMSTATGDLPLHSIPQIVLNAGMKIKEYQDCIYDINHYSIDGYSRVRKVIRKLQKQMAPWGLYHQCLEILINNVEQICYDLNEFELYKYNLIFIPFMHILRDDNNTQHFGIIIDVTNRKRKQISKQQKQISRQQKRAIAKHIARSRKNSKSNDNKMFACFAMGDIDDEDIKQQIDNNIKNNKNNKNNKNGRNNDNNDTEEKKAADTVEQTMDQTVERTEPPVVNKVASIMSVASNSVVSSGGISAGGISIGAISGISEESPDRIGMDVMDKVDINGIIAAKQFRFELENISSLSASISNNITRETSTMSPRSDDPDELSCVEDEMDGTMIPYTESHGHKLNLKIYLPRHLRPDEPDELFS